MSGEQERDVEAAGRRGETTSLTPATRALPVSYDGGSRPGPRGHEGRSLVVGGACPCQMMEGPSGLSSDTIDVHASQGR